MEGELKVVETDAQLKREIERLASPAFRKEHGKLLAVDTETNGFDPLAEGSRLLLVQLGVPGITWVVNACKCDVRSLKETLEDPYWLCILQNAKFDYKWLKAVAGIELQRMYDTQIAELLIIAGGVGDEKARLRQTTLRALVSKYLNIELDKSVRKSFVGHRGDTFSDKQIEYAADDIPYLFRIMKAQTTAMKRDDLLEIARIEFRCLPAVGDMELTGIRVDVPSYQKVIDRSREEMDKKAKVLSRIIVEGGAVQQQSLAFEDYDAPPINLQSNAQLLKVFHHFGLEVESTKEKEIKNIDHPLVLALLDYREWVKRVTTYGENVLEKIHERDGRIHAEFLQLGSDAGRFSCQRPNLQNIPATVEYRSLFVAEKGHKLIKGDWSQFELRILGEFSQDTGMLEAFRAGLDMHTDTAARMFGLPYEKVDKKGPERQAAKILNFALCYGMGPQSLAESLTTEARRNGADVTFTIEDAKEKMKLWFAARPEAGEWLNRAGQAANDNGECRTLANRRRLFFAPPSSASFKEKKRMRGSIGRKGKNTPIQGSNADMLKIAMRMVRDALREAGIVGKNVGLVACVHDEIVIEVPEAQAPEGEAILSTCMRKAGEVYLHTIPVVSETAVASYWVK